MHRVRQQDLPFQGSSHQFGSTVADVVHFEDRILLPYRPRLVVFYAGDNDLAMGRTPEQVVGDYRAFIARLRSALPAARVAFVSIKPSPSRRAYIDRVRETNRRIRMEIARDSLQAYLDIFTPMLDATGEPRGPSMRGHAAITRFDCPTLWLRD